MQDWHPDYNEGLTRVMLSISFNEATRKMQLRMGGSARAAPVWSADLNRGSRNIVVMGPKVRCQSGGMEHNGNVEKSGLALSCGADFRFDPETDAAKRALLQAWDDETTHGARGAHSQSAGRGRGLARAGAHRCVGHPCRLRAVALDRRRVERGELSKGQLQSRSTK